MTRALDPTRPVNDASGYVHVATDIFSVHDYDQNPATFIQRYDLLSRKRSRLFAYRNNRHHITVSLMLLMNMAGRIGRLSSLLKVRPG